MTLAVLPDAELVVIDWLRAAAEVVALVDETNISTKLPATPSWPRLTVNRVGGVPLNPLWIDTASIQVSAWQDPDTVEAQRSCGLLARTARASLISIRGWEHDEAWVVGCADDSPLTWLPDDSRDQPVPRYVFGVAVTLHP